MTAEQTETHKDAATLAREYGLSVEQFLTLGAAVVRDFAPEKAEGAQRILVLESGMQDALRSLRKAEVLTDSYYARRALETALGGDLRHHTYTSPRGQFWVNETEDGLSISVHGFKHTSPPVYVVPECANVVRLVIPSSD